MPVIIKDELILVFEKTDTKTNEIEEIEVVVTGSNFGLEEKVVARSENGNNVVESCIYKAFMNYNDDVEDLQITIPIYVTNGELIEDCDLKIDFNESVDVDDNHQIKYRLIDKNDSLSYIINPNHEIDEDEIIYPKNRDW